VGLAPQTVLVPLLLLNSWWYHFLSARSARSVSDSM
jgi:hypothetical protein